MRELTIAVTHRFKGCRCSGVRVAHTRTHVHLGVNIHPEYAVALTPDDAMRVGLRLMEMGYRLSKEQQKEK